MKNYVIGVKTDFNIGAPEFVSPFVQDWFSRLPRELQPDRFGPGEPARLKVADVGVEGVIEAWLKSRRPLVLKRVAKPKFQTTGDWRERKGLDRRLFPWHITVWLDPKAGDQLALLLFRFLIERLKPAFGSIAAYEDKREKHFVSLKDRGMTIESYEGLDVGEKLPGIYWATYFGEWSLQKLGRDKFAGLPAHRQESVASGVLVIAYPECSMAGSEQAGRSEDRLLDALGREHFFNKKEGHQAAVESWAKSCQSYPGLQKLPHQKEDDL